MSIKETNSYYILKADTLANWIDKQPDKWWLVDGDPVLMAVVDFPCPSDELSPAIRRIGKDLLIADKDRASENHGTAIQSNEIDRLSDKSDRRKRKTWLLCWSDSDIDWLLKESEAMVAEHHD